MHTLCSETHQQRSAIPDLRFLEWTQLIIRQKPGKRISRYKKEKENC